MIGALSCHSSIFIAPSEVVIITTGLLTAVTPFRVSSGRTALLQPGTTAAAVAIASKIEIVFMVCIITFLRSHSGEVLVGHALLGLSLAGHGPAKHRVPVFQQ